MPVNLLWGGGGERKNTHGSYIQRIRRLFGLLSTHYMCVCVSVCIHVFVYIQIGGGIFSQSLVLQAFSDVMVIITRVLRYTDHKINYDIPMGGQ